MQFSGICSCSAMAATFFSSTSESAMNPPGDVQSPPPSRRGGSRLQDVLARRVGAAARILALHAGRQPLRAGSFVKPGDTFRPPGTVALAGDRLPSRLRRCIGPWRLLSAPVASTAMARLRHDAGVVAAAGEQESHIGVGQQVDLVRRRQGATWSCSVPTAKIGARMSLSAIGRPSTRKRPSARSLFRNSCAGIRCACGRACAWRRRSRP